MPAPRRTKVIPVHEAVLTDSNGTIVAQTLPATRYQDALYRAVKSFREGCEAVYAYIHSPDGTIRRLTFATNTLRRISG